MPKKPAPLKHEQIGAYAELAARPNPEGYTIAFVPSLAALLGHAEKQKRADLSATEVVRVRDRAPAIALRPQQHAALRVDRGYDDVDPSRAYESWCELKRDMDESDVDEPDVAD